MKKFEYKLVNTESGYFGNFDYKRLNEHLNQLGGLGWEIVTTVSTATGFGQTTGLIITLKREIQP